ncbi:MAG: Crp/Fnr family transcriptional regulator, partial [Lachnospiraceae bacterium]|nr:Crp/Fnr family transcriptional regulator [Lachnospiraceae bacterium]
MSELIVKAGETLVSAGQSFDKLCIMKSGRIRVCCEGGSYELGPGDVVGICEVLSEVHILSYIVVEDTSFFVYPVTGIESIDLLINSNPDIARICIRSCFRQITRIIHS